MPRPFWKRVEAWIQPTSKIEASLSDANRALKRRDWKRVAEALKSAEQRLQGQSGEREPLRARCLFARLSLAAFTQDQEGLRRSAQGFDRLSSAGRAAVLHLSSIQHLCDDLLSKGHEEGALALMRALKGHLGESPKQQYLLGRVLIARLHSSKHKLPEKLKHTLLNQADEAFSRAGQRSSASRTLWPQIRRAGVCLLGESSRERAIEKAQEILKAPLNSFELPPDAQIIYAHLNLNTPLLLSRVRALDALISLAGSAQTASAQQLLWKYLASRAPGELAPLEVDRCRGAIQALFKGVEQREELRDIKRLLFILEGSSLVIRAPSQTQDAPNGLLCWSDLILEQTSYSGDERVFVKQYLFLMKLLQEEGFLALEEEEWAPLPKALNLENPFAWGLLILQHVLNFDEEISGIERLLQRATDPDLVRDAELRPLALLWPSLLSRWAKLTPIQPLIKQSLRRYLLAGHSPGYGVAKLSLLLDKQKAPRITAWLMLQAMDRGEVIVSKQLRGSLERGVQEALSRGDTPLAVALLQRLSSALNTA